MGGGRWDGGGKGMEDLLPRPSPQCRNGRGMGGGRGDRGGIKVEMDEEIGEKVGEGGKKR